MVLPGSDARVQHKLSHQSIADPRNCRLRASTPTASTIPTQPQAQIRLPTPIDAQLYICEYCGGQDGGRQSEVGRFGGVSNRSICLRSLKDGVMLPTMQHRASTDAVARALCRLAEKHSERLQTPARVSLILSPTPFCSTQAG